MANKKEQEHKKKIQEQHAEYRANIRDWILFSDAVDSTGGFSDGSYVKKYSHEDAGAYARRKELAYNLNHTAPVIDTYVGHLYKKPIIRQYDKNAELERFYSATNILGDKTITELMQKASATAMTFGHCSIMVDRTQKPEDSKVTSQAQEKAHGIKTYAYILTPKDIINWGMGVDGMLNFIVIKETYTTGNDDVWADHETATRYRLWTRTQWFVFEEGENTPRQSGSHNLGIIPIVTVYNATGSGYTIVGRSEIKDIAKINKTLFNKLSELDELMVNTAFNILAMDGSDLPQDKDGKANITLSNGRILTYSGNVPVYLSPSPDSIAAYETRIANLINEIYRIAKIEYTGGVSSSGIALAFKFEKTNQNLARKAENMADAERKLAAVVLKWDALNPANKNVDVQIIYPKDFGITDYQGEAVKDAKILDLAIGDEFEKYYRKTMIRKYAPEASESELAKMDAEIDAGEIPTMPDEEEEVA